MLDQFEFLVTRDQGSFSLNIKVSDLVAAAALASAFAPGAAIARDHIKIVGSSTVFHTRRQSRKNLRKTPNSRLRWSNPRAPAAA
jgi:hypothetical protein